MPDALIYRLTLQRLLAEAKREHTAAEERLAFDHDWEDWYAAYISARTYGLGVREANLSADDEVKSAHAILLSA